MNDIQKREIARINSLGGTVMYETADVSNLADMERVKRSAIDRFGKINGVIHAAMVLRDRILERMDENAFRAVLTPKVEGSIVLHQVFHNENLDFLIFFSSAQSFTGSRGQSNYSAASTFMDAYARYIDQEEIYPVYTMNWGYWGRLAWLQLMNIGIASVHRGFMRLGLRKV